MSNKFGGKVNNSPIVSYDVIHSKLKKAYTLNQDENAENRMCALHIVMNLPAMAIEFLDAFEGLLSEVEEEPGCKGEDIEKVQIWVHVYGFSREEEKVRKDMLLGGAY